MPESVCDALGTECVGEWQHSKGPAQVFQGLNDSTWLIHCTYHQIFEHIEKENLLDHYSSKAPGDQEDEITHVEHPHKTRMQILCPGANNSTSRDKFNAQAISATMQHDGSGSTYA